MYESKTELRWLLKCAWAPLLIAIIITVEMVLVPRIIARVPLTLLPLTVSILLQSDIFGLVSSAGTLGVARHCSAGSDTEDDTSEYDLLTCRKWDVRWPKQSCFHWLILSRLSKKTNTAEKRIRSFCVPRRTVITPSLRITPSQFHNSSPSERSPLRIIFFP